MEILLISILDTVKNTGKGGCALVMFYLGLGNIIVRVVAFFRVNLDPTGPLG